MPVPFALSFGGRYGVIDGWSAASLPTAPGAPLGQSSSGAGGSAAATVRLSVSSARFMGGLLVPDGGEHSHRSDAARDRFAGAENDGSGRLHSSRRSG